ncbi:GAF domain-containing protein [Halohasta salina]|uniref:GAF domain-containing protein n=1 Tax=Halohasta salina TaxID=2961621 RepID=UPI0020A30855|nr:GAF domain-containing protein [Halohasta salina]
MSRGAIRRNDTAAEQPAADLREPLRSELLAPIGRFGVVSVGSTEPDRFDSDAVDLLDGIAETLAATVDRIERSDGDFAGER